MYVWYVYSLPLSGMNHLLLCFFLAYNSLARYDVVSGVTLSCCDLHVDTVEVCVVLTSRVIFFVSSDYFSCARLELLQ